MRFGHSLSDRETAWNSLSSVQPWPARYAGSFPRTRCTATGTQGQPGCAITIHSPTQFFIPFLVVATSTIVHLAGPVLCSDPM
ncbi:hypothetical protein PoB_005766100 [Plakobranchus ocellatus]|uniref:Uncharacterized protein n=1 Tax=Plakobranchus ocellatus TaxID=259542 RepID=A0AAV4CI69_9GAST|nr:hypothetical protein PoB_005766100 [Plakobranchus ocellatus]